MLNVTPILKLFAASRARSLAAHTPAQVQQGQLLALLRAAQNTAFGKAHGFSGIHTVAEYQRRVPLRTYEQFWEEYWKPAFPRLTNCTWPGTIPFFAVSSGTSSGRTKYIPLSQHMVRSNTKAGTDLLIHHVLNRPTSKLMGGRSFMLGGSTDLTEQAPGIFSGDLSGIAVKTLPWWAAARYFPPAHLALLKNWEEKIAILAKQSLTQDIRMLSGVPSWILIFLKELWRLRPETEGSLRAYPHFEMLVHGGVNFAPYQRQFTELARATNAELREVYPASEGFVAVADRGSGEGLRVVLDHGIFFEFIPVEELNSSNPKRHWIGSIEPNVNYAIVLTTCAGLWSYILGDTVKFVDTRTPRLLVTGRTSYFLSAFGEHLSGEEVERAVADAANSIGRSITDYSIGALYPQSTSELGGHLIIAEFEGGEPTSEQVASFAAHLDSRLSELNEDFEAHRASGFGLNAPRAHAVAPGTFAAWMKSRGKLGGQHKVPRIIVDPELFKNLQSFVGDPA
ncbi:MAG: auxin-regulated protein [Proteobacteria bacterium]|nr:auxin-regulated protein [Pseudomonadota bacterium]